MPQAHPTHSQPAGPKVNVALCILGKPYQTSLSVVSLLEYSGQHVDTFYLHFETAGLRYDKVLPYFIADYLGDRAKLFQPEHWLQCNAYEPEKTSDSVYRRSIRYQTAFEHSPLQYLFIMHNDVLVKKDIVGALLNSIDGAFAIGSLGQCWNCPASREEFTQAAGLGPACTPQTYQSFRPSLAELARLYSLAHQQGMHVRPYWEGWQAHYTPAAWPLPECRVNEWGCLVDIQKTRPLTIPLGDAPPFGVFEHCGTVSLDTSVAWFREISRKGLYAKHFDIAPYLTHWVGNGKMDRYKYLAAEDNARHILEKHFKRFVAWCRENNTGLF